MSLLDTANFKVIYSVHYTYLSMPLIRLRLPICLSIPLCFLGVLLRTMTYICPRNGHGLGGNSLRNRGMNMSKRIMCGILFLLCLVTSGCPLFVPMSDRLAYGFRGTIRSASNHEIIPEVRVTASCRKARLDLPLETVSDERGFFFLHGFFVGELDDACELSFSHPQFKPKLINLTKTRDFSYEGAAYVSSLDIELEPN